MITVLGILGGAVLGTRYKVLCLVPITATAILVLATLDHINKVALSSTALSALALAVGLQIGYLVGAIVRSLLMVALEGRVAEPERLRDQPARIF